MAPTFQLKLGTDKPRKEDVKFLMMAPDTSGKTSCQDFPAVSDLENPEGYYQQVCVPRQERALRRIMFNKLHRHAHNLGRQGKTRTNRSSPSRRETSHRLK